MPLRTFSSRTSSKQGEKGSSSGGRTIEPEVSGSPRQEGSEVELAAKGDQRAFERLYRMHHGRIFSLAIRMTGPQWAEDLTQEVFIRAWRKLGTFRGDASFGTWLYRLAVNLILSRRETLRRLEQRQGGDGEMLDRLPAREKPPGFAMDFEAAVRRLPDGARQVFVLYEIEGYPHAEIGEMMGISTGTSKSQLHRARMILRDYLN
jgi:RNA polymerase sigma-70 factor (ECF subfamily)